MSKLENIAAECVGAIVLLLGAVFVFLLGLFIATLGAIFRALPWIIVIGFVVWLCTGCVYQPINIDVYVPTEAYVGGDVVLDAHKEIRDAR